jgi:F-type H+-transporting ATPase subunit c
MEATFAYLGAGLGAGITVLGAATGIGRLGAAALEASGRQPEATGDVRTTMIIAAALIEGLALFSEVICILLAIK